MTRISGISSGMDTDAMVKELMSAYQTKLDNTEKKKMVLEYKQEAYQSVTSDLRDFYDKYFSTASKECILLTSTWNNTSFTSSNSSVLSVTGSSSAILGDYTVDVKEVATTAKKVIATNELSTLTSIEINGEVIDISGAEGDPKKMASVINAALSKSGITATYSEISGGLIIQTTETGSNQSFSIKYGSNAEETISGTDCEFVITNSDGISLNKTSSSNKVTIDGMTLTLKQKGTSNISGEKNIDEIKDKLVNFVNEYNELIIKLNTLVSEKYDSDYLPLTDSEKEAMSDSQIELWEKKAKTGLLYGDSDLKRIIRNLKQTMSSVMGTTLKSIGIEPVSSFGDAKSGTYSIDEDKLNDALTNNFESVKQLFLDGTKSTTITNPDGSVTTTPGKSGILNQMKDIFYNESQSTSAALIKKAGLENNASLSSTLKTQIAKYEQKLTSLNTWYNKKEASLYKKFAKMESSLALINNQYTSLSALFTW